MPNVFFRPALPPDATAIGAIQCAAWQQRLAVWAPAEFIRSRFGDPALATERYAARIIDPRFVVLVATRSTKPNTEPPVAFAAYQALPDAAPPGQHELTAFYVHPDHEGQGVGTGLLRGLLNLWQADPMRQHLRVWTFAANAPARHLYSKCEGRFVEETSDPPGMDLNIPHVCYGWSR